MAYNFNDRRRIRGGGPRNKYGQAIKVKGVLKTDTEQKKSSNDKADLTDKNKTPDRSGYRLVTFFTLTY